MSDTAASASGLNLDAVVEAFDRDGAVKVRSVISADRVARMRTAIDEVIAHREAPHQERAAKGRGRFYNGFFNWLHHDEIRDFVLHSELAELAARFLRAQRINFFYDQLLVKEPHTPDPTPWHQDAPYYPLIGGRVLSVWTPFDPIARDNGPIIYVRHSHRWAQKDVRADSGQIGRLPQPGEPSDEFEFLSWDMEPGDCLIHDGYAVHASPANASNTRRRALATRWADQNVRFQPGANSFLKALSAAGQPVPEPDLAAGDPLSGPLFPLVWPRARHGIE